MNKTHTKGPWILNGCGEKDCFIDDDKGLQVATTYSAELSGMPEAIANARLIAAAPELLEACIKALNELEPNTISAQYVRSELEKAISKAEGRDE